MIPVPGESARVYYSEGQKLHAADLSAEQTYLTSLDARHYTGQHSTGVVRGLHVGLDALGDPAIQPGIVIDDSGREVLLQTSQPMPEESLDCWLVYCRLPLRLRQPGRSDCGPTAFQRWREFGQVVTIPATESSAPSSPAEGALYLGRIGSGRGSDTTYATLVGCVVRDPGGRSLLQVGPLTGRDRNGFVVRADNGTGSLTPRLLIDRQTNNKLQGSVTLLGYRARVVVPAPEKKSRIMVEAQRPGPAGELVHVRFGSGHGGAAYDLEFLSGQTLTERLTFSAGPGNLQDDLRKFNKTSLLVNVTRLAPGDDGETHPPRQSSARRLR